MSKDRENRVCLSIRFDEIDDITILDGIRKKISKRKPTMSGNTIYYRDTGTYHKIRQEEHETLVKLGTSKITGTIRRVDGIFSYGINVDAVIPNIELRRVQTDYRYHVSAIFNRHWISKAIRERLHL